jgi:thiol:disulfide interchange protein DsbC
MMLIRILSCCLLLVTASYANPPAANAPAPAAADPRAQLASKIPGTRAEDFRPSVVPGLYEMTHGLDIAYVTADGQYAFSGDLIELAKNDNLTETRRRALRAKLIGDVPESEMLVFGPRDPKYTVTVFTDVDCAYCRQLHSQISEYNRLGIRVRYLFFPRSGPNTESWTKAERVWCSTNRNEALTVAKRGGAVQGKSCPNPVARHYALGRDFGLQGTPAIIGADGELIGGYMPPPELMQHLAAANKR